MNYDVIQSQQTSSQTHLVLHYIEQERAFHIFYKGKRISVLIPGDKIAMKTFREILELLNRDEDYK